MGAIFSILIMIIHLGVLIYIISLFGHLVRAVEEIADKSELATRMLEVMLEKIASKPEKTLPPTES